MKLISISLIKIFFRLLFSYGICLLFTEIYNPLEWRTAAKIIFVIISVSLLSQDYCTHTITK